MISGMNFLVNLKAARLIKRSDAMNRKLLISFFIFLLLSGFLFVVLGPFISLYGIKKGLDEEPRAYYLEERQTSGTRRLPSVWHQGV